jgi:hypothetical protein
MPPTPDQKLVALRRRLIAVEQPVAVGFGFIGRTADLLADADMALTAPQKAGLVARWQVIRTALVAAANNLPANLATWEPDPTEYEGGP